MTHFAHRTAKATKISRYFSTAREMVGLPGGPGRLLQHGQTSKLVTVLGNFWAKADERQSRRADNVAPIQFGEEVAAIHLAAGADSFGAREATIFSKRGSPRSGSQKGSSFKAP